MLAFINQSPPVPLRRAGDVRYMHLLHEPIRRRTRPRRLSARRLLAGFQTFPLHWFDDKLYGVMSASATSACLQHRRYTPKRSAVYEAMWSEKAKGKVGFFDWYLPRWLLSLSNGNKPPFDIDEAAFEAVKEKLFSLEAASRRFYTIATSSRRSGTGRPI